MMRGCWVVWVVLVGVGQVWGKPVASGDRLRPAQSVREPSGTAIKGFLGPVPDAQVIGAALKQLPAASDQACADACLQDAACISFSRDSANITCTLNQWSVDYAIADATGARYYHRLQPRNDARAYQAVPFQVEVPTSNVTLTPGSVLRRAFDANIIYLLGHPTDDLLYFFRLRNGNPNPPGQCWGWDANLRGSLAGEFLMGSGGISRWPMANATLRARMDEVVAGILQEQEADGYAMGFARNETWTHENPDYVTSWVTHGLLEAAIAGNEQALPLIRRHLNWFNNCTWLPLYLPPDDRTSSSLTNPNTQGHGIYLIYQGIIHNTRMSLTELGTQQDIEVVSKLMQEDWWLRELAARNQTAVWRRNWFPHNYELTGIEAYMDMYIMTGNSTYLDAVQGAWDLFWHHWIHLGGSIAINEPWAVSYPPGSYYLDFTDQHHEGMTLRYGEAPACQGPSVDLEHQKQWFSAYVRDVTGHPTGELCGSMFWLKLNQRFHRLDPLNETFVTEMEREIFNVGVANQEPNGLGIRYFALLHKNKQVPTTTGTCCEGQGTRMLGSLPEYVFSYNGTAVFVNLYTAASAHLPQTAGDVDIVIDTVFPYDSAANITIAAAGSGQLDVFVRIPSWQSGTVDVRVDGAVAAHGTPGTFVHLSVTRGTTSHVVELNLQAALTSHLYTGLTQVNGTRRYGVLHGPILMAATGPVNVTTGVVDVALPAGAQVSDPASFLTRDVCPADGTTNGGFVFENGTLFLECAHGGTIENVSFASFGNPTGTCGNYVVDPACHAPESVQVVTALCRGQSSCAIAASDALFGDPCVGMPKRLAVTVTGCAPAAPNSLDYVLTENPAVRYTPYFSLQGELFDVFPVWRH